MLLFLIHSIHLILLRGMLLWVEIIILSTQLLRIRYPLAVKRILLKDIYILSTKMEIGFCMQYMIQMPRILMLLLEKENS